MPKENAKAQLRALYASEDRMEGKGIVDDIRSSLKAAYNEVADMDSASWKKVKQVGDLDSEFWVTSHLPTEAQTYLDEHGGDVVEQVIIRKAPVVKALETALELFSLGKWEKAKADMGYDTMFHLSLILNKNTILEKLARINIGKVDNPPYPEFSVVTVKGKVTLKEMVEKTKKHMGDKFYPYDPFYNNCQDFVNAVLVANKDVLDYDAEDKIFVKQDLDTMIRDLPTYLPKFARTITSLGGLTGGDVPQGQDVLWQIADSAYKKGENSKRDLPGGLTLLEKTDGMVLYGDGDKSAFVGVRGTRPTDTDDLYADSLIPLNNLGISPRFERDSAKVREWKEKYPNLKDWYGIGHSLGGALVDELMRYDLLIDGFSFNPAIQPRDFVNPNHVRLYMEGDPMYDLFGRQDPNAIVLPRQEEGWLYWVWRHTLAGKLYDYLVSHKLAAFGELSGGAAPTGEANLAEFAHTKASFRDPSGIGDDVMLGGGKEVDAEALFDALEDLVGGAFAPRFLYNTAEERTPRGDARRPEDVRSERDRELGLRALAHKYGADSTTPDPLRAFAARVMADDLYEHRTGDPVDWEHNFRAQREFKESFRDSRAEQMAEKALVDAMMAKHNISRERAYNIVYAGEREPALRVAPPPRVRPAAEVQAEMEAARLQAEADRQRREEQARRDAEEAARRAQAAEDHRRREREEEARRLAEEAARNAERDAERAQREEIARRDEEERRRAAAAREAEEASAREELAAAQRERDAARRQAEEERARADALILAGREIRSDEDWIPYESKVQNALIEEERAAEKRIRTATESIARYQKRITEKLAFAERIEADPEKLITGQVPLVGVFGGDTRVSRTLSPRIDAFSLRKEITDLRKYIDTKTPEELSAPVPAVGERFAEGALEGKKMYVFLGEHPTARDFSAPWQMATVSIFIPAPLLPAMLENVTNTLRGIMDRVPEQLEVARETREVTIPAFQARLAEAQADLTQAEASLREIKARRKQVDKELKAQYKELQALIASAAKAKEPAGKKKPKGGGQQHKPFPYEDPDADEDEKAAERARHYRQTLTLTRRWEPKVQYGRIKSTIRDPKVSRSDQNFVKSIRETEKKRREVETAEPEKKLAVREANRLFEVEAKEDAPASYKAKLAARGPKVFPPKKTMPKAGSVRKPYVGKKMKEAFMEAVKERGVKEQRNLFNRAKRLYKEGGKSWEEVITQVAG